MSHKNLNGLPFLRLSKGLFVLFLSAILLMLLSPSSTKAGCVQDTAQVSKDTIEGKLNSGAEKWATKTGDINFINDLADEPTYQKLANQIYNSDYLLSGGAGSPVISDCLGTGMNVLKAVYGSLGGNAPSLGDVVELSWLQKTTLGITNGIIDIYGAAKNIFTVFGKSKSEVSKELPAQVSDTLKNDYQDCPAYLFLIVEYMKTQPSISTIQSKINSLSIGNVEVIPTDNKVLISVRGDDTLALEATRQKISQALSELSLQETRMDVVGNYRAKTCVSNEDFLKRQNPLPPEKKFGGDWKADWRSTDNQSGYSDIKIYAVQQLTDSKGVEGIMLSGEGTQYFGNKITTFRVSATVIGEEITLYQYFNEIKDTVIYKGTISVDRGNGTWANTLRSSGTWSMTRE
ncbi:MAG: hypothetical protein Q7R65_01240 [bacterium]|nr:hypothetical protein [bacterium]